MVTRNTMNEMKHEHDYYEFLSITDSSGNDQELRECATEDIACFRGKNSLFTRKGWGWKVRISECDLVCVINERGVCLCSRIHMTHSVSHSMKSRRSIAVAVNDVCWTMCCESSTSRPSFVSLYHHVSTDFVPLFWFRLLYRICLALCVGSIYSCGPIHCEEREEKHIQMARNSIWAFMKVWQRQI